mmetsp:Transcript_20318/g.36286  ORF Transcript_20318/g.36286 Transcript_20318/m.36286 type:complete len:307 (-) Transcript_20318:55-975(-)
MCRSPAADAHQQAFLHRQPPGHLHGRVLVHSLDFIHDIQVQRPRNEPGTNALNFVGAWSELLPVRELCEDRGVDGLHGDGMNGFASAPEITANTRDGASRAHTGHKNIDVPIGCLPDLGACGQLMDHRVGRVGELLRHVVPVGVLLTKILSGGDGPLHAQGGLCEDDLGPVGFHHLAALDGHAFWNCEHALIAAGRRHKGKGDARVAGRGLHNGHAGPEQPLRLCIPNHRRPNAALDAVGWVPALDLGKDLLGCTPKGHTVQLDQWGTADGHGIVFEVLGRQERLGIVLHRLASGENSPSLGPEGR